LDDRKPAVDYSTVKPGKTLQPTASLLGILPVTDAGSLDVAINSGDVETLCQEIIFQR
jgi:hypothetical protein